MPYRFYKKNSPGFVVTLAEQEYGTAKVIHFTKFTSCIGVVAVVGDKLCGVHLVRWAVDKYIEDPNKRTTTSYEFDEDTARKVLYHLFEKAPVKEDHMYPKPRIKHGGITGYYDSTWIIEGEGYISGLNTIYYMGFVQLEKKPYVGDNCVGAMQVGGQVKFFNYDPKTGKFIDFLK